MRNRAKCKKCNDIIESLHQHDFVTCKCGAISIDGGSYYYRCVANDLADIIRVDDEGNEIIPKIIEKDNVKPPDIQKQKPTKKEKLKMLKEMCEGYERLSADGLSGFATNYDLLSALLMLWSILQED